jgi:ABC-2 type transport system permease protein
MREVKERVRGRIFRIGTLFMLLAVGAAIIIPTIKAGTGLSEQAVGVVGVLPPGGQQLIREAASRDNDYPQFVAEPTVAAAKSALLAGQLDFAVVDGRELLLKQPASSNGSPADPGLVQAVASYLGALNAYERAGLSPQQASTLERAEPIAVRVLQGVSKATTKATSVIGLVLLFFMLTQYNTWILIGVMQEKSSRVVEVLLATVRPLQLLGGKVLGIGLVALGQAALIVGFSFVVAEAVGSDLLRSTAPLVLLVELMWLVLGYAFYCWVYAAAGSTAERQDQVQTLALPLSIPILLG